MSWTVFIESATVRHVITLDDEQEHQVSAWDDDSYPFDSVPTCDCPCRPRREYKDNICIFTHSSFDGREGLEWASEILSPTSG